MSSYPPTEIGEVSMNSLFEDSVQFDAAEKLPDPDAIPTPVEEEVMETSVKESTLPTEVTALLSSVPQLNLTTGNETELTFSNAAHMKPRRTPTAQPIRWVPIDLKVPEGDTEDEFDIGTARNPVYREADAPKPKFEFRNGEPDFEGDITNCFDEPGLLYRIVNKKTKSWAFYNDSLMFEINVECTFGKHSRIEALDNATVSHNEAGEFVVEVTVYPGETEMFVKGYINGFTSKLRAIPLSDDYYIARSERQREGVIESEIEAIRAVVGDEIEPEIVLQACLEHNLPFVDLSFPPEQGSLDAGSSSSFKCLPWARPTQFLKPELRNQVRLFRSNLRPDAVLSGDLGDCWILCAVATLSEDPEQVFTMFRHPKGAEQGRRERAMGAYRVTFKKNGLWRSVLVDDYLPVLASMPKFARTRDPCEIWPCILEKAFAKLHHSYAMIQSGDPMHVLTDMSGIPSMRFDEDLAKAIINDDGVLFNQLAQYNSAGYQLILTTPGKAPALIPGSENEPDFVEPELEKIMEGSGMLPGHAYTILQAKSFHDKQTRLVQLRNPWPYGDEYDGEWSRTSAQWSKNPDVANAVNFDPEDTSCTWMPWEVVLRYFQGGGVLFKQSDLNELCIPITFYKSVPSMVWGLQVTEPTRVCLVLSNMDYRGMHAEEKGAAETDPINTDYPPIMISLTSAIEENTDVHRVELNTTVDPMNPSTSKWTFLQAREICMFCDLDPKHSPYLVIPRVMEPEGDDQPCTSREDYQNSVNPVHFVNSFEQTRPEEYTNDMKEIPVTLSLRVAGDFISNGHVMLMKLDLNNPVFENFPKFPVDDLADITADVYFQTKDPAKGYADENMGPPVK